MSSSAYQTCFIGVRPLKAAYKTCVLDFLSTRKHRVRLRGSRIDPADWSVKMIDNWPSVLVDLNQTGWILSRAAEGASAWLSRCGNNPLIHFKYQRRVSNPRRNTWQHSREHGCSEITHRLIHSWRCLFIQCKMCSCYHNLLTWSSQTWKIKCVISDVVSWSEHVLMDRSLLLLLLLLTVCVGDGAGCLSQWHRGAEVYMWLCECDRHF